MKRGQQELKHLLLTRFRMRQLVAYIAVYEHRNIQAAARELALDHSTVSKSISEIEAVLEAELFARHTRGVTPTPAADVLYRHARQIVNQCARTAAELSRITAETSTHIVIGCVSYLDTVAVRAVSRFKAQREEGQIIRLIFGRTKDLHRRLELGEVDLLIARLGIAEDQAGIKSIKAYDVGDIIVVRSDHPCAGRDDVALEDLIRYPWVLPPPNNPFRSYLEGLFYQEGLALPSNVFEIASMFAVRAILLENPNLVCTLPSKSLCKEIEEGTVAQLNVPIPLNPPPVGVL
ncbi:MAG TPA: LysR family transcriptional regulator, partial [Gammaproteobacteria bacterium]|nr:LysR family transcriptional regulator [Gammaproteobacteria bacterium]